MYLVSGRFVIVFKEEIYNYLVFREKLRSQELAPNNWRGHLDTETLLALFIAWGVKETLEKLVDMFAIALWDCEYQLLTLERDRIGEKLLYWGWQGESLYFSSEHQKPTLFSKLK